MSSYLSSLPSIGEFFPPTPRAAAISLRIFQLFTIVSVIQWTPLRTLQAMGKTSSNSRFNLPGRLTWTAAESIGPLNLVYILMTLPSKLKPPPHATSSFLGTGLPAQHEILACLYLLHYVNRAVVSPLYLAPSMSPMSPLVVLFMTVFQFTNSTNIASLLVYSTGTSQAKARPIVSLGSLLGLAIFFLGLVGNVWAETTLFDLRRGAAKRKAKSEGKAQVTYDKVYVIPPAEGVFRHMLYPHYALEWLEWTGYWILGAAWGLDGGLQSPFLWFVVIEIATMLPRAVSGRQWYETKFGKRAVARRAAVVPGIL